MARGREAIDRDLAFGLVAASRGLVDCVELAGALEAREADPSRSLRDLLIEAGSLSAGTADDVEEQVDDALAGLLSADSRVAGRFRVLRPYARGGVGEVFVAEDAELHREVALKEIQPHHADDPDSRARFVVEAEITGGLEHPGIVPVYSLGRHADGRPYYAMRLVKGQTLLEAIRRFHEPDGPAGAGPRGSHRELRRLLTRFVAVCEAIAYAHSRRVVHRDLKPRNILLGRYGETLVVDWGSAKAMDDPDPDSTALDERPIRPASGRGIEATVEGRTVGTPAYMPPEQAEARPDATAPAADIFGLGATLYHLLVGRAPFEADGSDAALRLARQAAFPPPRAVRPEVPWALEAICLRATAREPEGRYPSALALAEDVERWLGDEPVLARPEPPAARLARWARRNQSRATAAVAGLLLLTTTLAAFSYRQKGLVLHESREREARENAAHLEAQRVAARRQVEEADQQARIKDYYARLDRARAARSSAPPGWTAVALAELAAAVRLDAGTDDTSAFRDEAIAALSAVDLRPARAIDPGIESTLAPTVAVRPDGLQAVAFRHRPWGHLDYTARVVDLATGSPVRTLAFRARNPRFFQSPEEICDAAFSPNGHLLAAATSDGRVHLWDLRRPEPAPMSWDPSEQRVSSVAFSADGRSVYCASKDKTLRRWELRDDPTAGEPVEVARADVASEARVFRLPGTAEVFSVRDRALVRHHPGTLEVIGSEEIGEVADEPIHTCPSPDGRSLAFVRGGEVGLLTLGGGPTRMLQDGRIAPRSVGIHYTLRFSPDGSLLMAFFSDYAGHRRGVKLWEVGSGRLACARPAPGIERVGAAFTPDGRRVLVVEERKLSEYEVGGLDVQPRLAHAPAPIRAIALSPDGSTLASLARRPAGPDLERVEATLWGLPGGARGAERAGPDAPRLVDLTARHSLAFDPSGRRLAIGTGASPLHFWDLADPARAWATVETGGIHPVVAFAGPGRDLWGIMGRRDSDDRVVVVDPDRPSVEDRWVDAGSRVMTGMHGLNDIAAAGDLAVVAAHDGDLLLLREGDPPGSARVLKAGGAARDPAQVVALGPDAARVAIGTQSGRLVLRPVPEGRPILTRDAHRDRVTALAFSRDARLLATGATDRAIRLWSTERGDLRAVATLPATEAAVVALAFSPDGRHLYALVDGECAVRAWDLDRLRDRLAGIGLRW